MNRNARYLIIGILLITVSLMPVQAALLAQDTGDPAATEDPCVAIVNAALANENTPAPDSIQDPAVTSCLKAMENNCFDILAASAIQEDSPDAAKDPMVEGCTQLLSAREVPTGPTPTPLPDTAAEHTFTVENHSDNWLARFWLTWHEPNTGALIALGSGAILTNTSGKLTIPSGAVSIGIRIEQFSGNTWLQEPQCYFGFADAHQDQTMAIWNYDHIGGFGAMITCDLLAEDGSDLATAEPISLQTLRDLNLTSDSSTSPTASPDQP